MSNGKYINDYRKSEPEFLYFNDPPLSGIFLSMKSWKILTEFCFLFEFKFPEFLLESKLNKILTELRYIYVFTCPENIKVFIHAL